MKTTNYCLLLIASLLISSTVNATRRLVAITHTYSSGTEYMTLSYDSNGRIQSLTVEGVMTSTFDYSASDRITINKSYVNGNSDIEEIILEGGRISKRTNTISSDGMSILNTFSFDGDYLSEAKVYVNDKLNSTITGTWTNGNLTHVINNSTQISFEYTSMWASEIESLLFSYFALLDQSYLKNMPSIWLMMGNGILGKMPEVLVSKSVETKSSGTSKETTLTYTLDSEGYVSTAILQKSSNSVHNYTLSWENVDTYVRAINTAKQQDGVRYNLAGQKVDESYKGVVIMNGRKMVQK